MPDPSAGRLPGRQHRTPRHDIGSYVANAMATPNAHAAKSAAGSASSTSFRPIAAATGPLARKNTAAKMNATVPDVSPVDVCGRPKSLIGDTRATTMQIQTAIHSTTPDVMPAITRTGGGPTGAHPGSSPTRTYCPNRVDSAWRVGSTECRARRPADLSPHRWRDLLDVGSETRIPESQC
jgi:hypothetical protein